MLRSEAGRFPVVAGIPVLTLDISAATVVKLLDEAHTAEALLRLLSLQPVHNSFQRKLARLLPLQRWRATVQAHLDRVDRERQIEASKELLQESTTFCKLASKALWPENAHCKRLRFSDPTYLPAYTLAQAAADHAQRCGGRVVDIGCGAGHVARVLANCLGPERVVGVDCSFLSLYLAKRFIVQDSLLVCCDAQQGLPFRSQEFSAVFSSDALHYMPAKRVVIAEMRRVLTESGLLVLAHLHNALEPNVSAGSPLTPAGYRRLLDGCNTVLASEADILEAQLAGERGLDVRNTPADNARALFSMSGAVPTLIPVRYPNEPRDDEEGNWQINPIFEIEPNGDHVIARRRFPSHQYETEFADAVRYLPESVTVPRSLFRQLPLSRLHDTLARQLAQQFVLLNLPESYV
ncbi:MAG: methyltransferase domain-containing protein [Chloroflexi bacterium]|nr:methyltransferase domain-containing protein [Chloroflexota bacterium]